MWVCVLLLLSGACALLAALKPLEHVWYILSQDCKAHLMRVTLFSLLLFLTSALALRFWILDWLGTLMTK